MIKGIQRKMVLIRTPDSKLFEEAHLVLRLDGGETPAREGEILNEANRIVERAGLGLSRSRRSRGRGALGGRLGFLLGGLVGGGLVGALWLLLSFLL